MGANVACFHLLTNIIIHVINTFQLKEKAVADIFETAPVLVNSVTESIQDAMQPEASRPAIQALYQLCSRARSGLRPEDPTDLEFEVTRSKRV